VGTLSTTSELVTSTWGDNGLFFRHQDMAEDLEIMPEWKPYTPYYTAPSTATYFKEAAKELANGTFNKVASACPFAYLWQ